MELRLSNTLGKLAGFEGGVWGWLPLSYLKGTAGECAHGGKEREKVLRKPQESGKDKNATVRSLKFAVSQR